MGANLALLISFVKLTAFYFIFVVPSFVHFVHLRMILFLSLTTKSISENGTPENESFSSQKCSRKGHLHMANNLSTKSQRRIFNLI